MRLRVFDDGAEFLAHAEPFLLAREAEHNLLLALSAGLARGEWSELHPYLATVEAAGSVCLVAFRTPPWNLVLSCCETLAALDLLVAELAPSLRSLPGVSGLSEIARAFAERWRSATGGSFEVAMAQRIYRLDRATPVRGVPGTLRPATLEDRGLLIDWYADFSKCERGIVHEDADKAVGRFLQGDPTYRRLFFWDVDGQPVSLVGHSGRTPNGMRIGPVYTPPPFRGRGYASAATAALSQVLLDSGRRFCFLYTDLANPTSNHIYQTIGYRPVADADQYRFSVEVEVNS